MAITNWDVGTGKTYAVIADAVNAIPNNLLNLGEQRVRVYAGGSHEGDGYFYDEAVDLSGGFLNESATDFVSMYAMVNHEGLRDHGIVVRAPANGATAYGIKTSQFTVVVGFCVTFDAPSTVLNRYLRGVYRDNESGLLDKCIIYDVISTNGTARAYGVYAPTGVPAITTAQIRNTEVMNIQAADRSRGIYVGANAANRVYNCSVHNVGGGGTQHHGIYVISDNAVVKNCISTGSEDADFFALGNNPTVEHCISSDDTADDWGGPGNQINKDPDDDVRFVSTTLGSEDLHIQRGTCAFDAGTNLSAEGFADDVEGHSRPFKTGWDIGADEWTPAGITPDLGWSDWDSMFDPRLNEKLLLLELDDLEPGTEVLGKYRIRGNASFEVEGQWWKIPYRYLNQMKDGVDYLYWIGDTNGSFTMVGSFLSEDEKKCQRVYTDGFERELDG